MNEDEFDLLVTKRDNIVKKVDKNLIAQRIAIEIKLEVEVFKNIHPVMDTYLDTSREELNYSKNEIEEILNQAKTILKEEYNITILNNNPLTVQTDKEVIKGNDDESK